MFSVIWFAFAAPVGAAVGGQVDSSPQPDAAPRSEVISGVSVFPWYE